jgi:hypothetical protein
MTSTDLTKDQAAAMQERIRQALVYVGAMRERMERRGLSPNDRLYRQTARAFDALHELHMGLHYVGCGMRTGNRTAGGKGYIVADGNPWAARIV